MGRVEHFHMVRVGHKLYQDLDKIRHSQCLEKMSINGFIEKVLGDYVRRASKNRD